MWLWSLPSQVLASRAPAGMVALASEHEAAFHVELARPPPLLVSPRPINRAPPRIKTSRAVRRKAGETEERGHSRGPGRT